MPSDEEKNVFLESLKKSEQENPAPTSTPPGSPQTPKRKGMSGPAMFATLFLLFLLVITLLIFIISVGGAQNPILQSFGIESGEVKEFLKSLVNWTFGTLTILLLLLFSIGIFRGVSARKDEKEKRRNSLIFGGVSGGLIFAVTLAWLAMFAYVNSLEASALGARNSIEITNIKPGEKIIAPLTLTFSARKVEAELLRQKKKIVRYLWDKDNDGNFEVQRGLDPEVNLWFTQKGVQVVNLRVELAGENPRDFQIKFIIDDVVFAATPTSGEVPLKVEFDASDITEGLSVKSFEWDFDGNGDYEETSTGAKISHTFTDIGIFQVGLRVRLQGDQVEDFSRAIEVSGATSERVKAIIEASPERGEAPLKVQFSGRRSYSAEGKIRKYSWSIAGTDTELVGDMVTYTFPDPGVYQVTLLVEDSIGLTGTTTSPIEVSAQLSLPEIVLRTEPRANDKSEIIAEISPLTVNFDASQSTDVDNDIVAYEWDFNDDAEADEYGEKVTHVFDSAGRYRVELVVRDAEGNIARKEIFVQIGADKIEASITATPETGSVPLTINFDGSRSSCGKECRIISFEWNFGDDTPPQITGAHVTHTFTKVGTFTVVLTVTTDSGKKMTGQKIVAVRVPPLVACFTPSRTSGKAPLAVSFKDCSDGTIESWKWDFGDGYISPDRAPEHTFENPGTYTVILAVTDVNNTTAKTSQVLTVE